jgi:hypothetical protein
MPKDIVSEMEAKAMAKLTATELKKHLRTYEQEELIQLITDLSEMSKKTREYLASEIQREETANALYAEAKQEVKELVSPDGKEEWPHLSRAKKTIKNFKVSTDNKPMTVDLMLYFVEEGTEFAKTRGNLDEKFYSRLVSMYARIAEECEQDELLFHKFNERLHKVLEAAAPIGTEYPAALTDIYHSISWVEDEE